MTVKTGWLKKAAFAAASRLGTTACIDPATLSTIRLKWLMYAGLSYPANAYADFILDGSIVFSQVFPTVLPQQGYKQFSINSGTYKISFRQDAIPGGAIIKYFVTPSVGNGFYIQNGDTISLSPGVTYDITIGNAF